MSPFKAVISFNPGNDLMKVLSPAKMIFELCPSTLSFAKVLIAVVICVPNVFASDGKLLASDEKENPLPGKSMNIRLAVLVNLFGFAESVISLLSLSGPIPPSE